MSWCRNVRVPRRRRKRTILRHERTISESCLWKLLTESSHASVNETLNFIVLLIFLLVSIRCLITSPTAPGGREMLVWRAHVKCYPFTLLPDTTLIQRSIANKTIALPKIKTQLYSILREKGALKFSRNVASNSLATKFSDVDSLPRVDAKKRTRWFLTCYYDSIINCYLLTRQHWSIISVLRGVYKMHKEKKKPLATTS